MEVLRREDVPSAPVNTLDRVMKDPQLLHRNMVAEEILHHPPALGEHTEEILRGLLDYSSQKVQELMEKKIIFQSARGE